MLSVASISVRIDGHYREQFSCRRYTNIHCDVSCTTCPIARTATALAPTRARVLRPNSFLRSIYQYVDVRARLVFGSPTIAIRIRPNRIATHRVPYRVVDRPRRIFLSCRCRFLFSSPNRTTDHTRRDLNIRPIPQPPGREKLWLSGETRANQRCRRAARKNKELCRRGHHI